MSEPEDKADSARVRGAKAAAREAIGKLIGDDAEIRKGRVEKRAAGAEKPRAADTNIKEQE
jgi:uncharacterized protein YjbJ (UPF0337 family)